MIINESAKLNMNLNFIMLCVDKEKNSLIGFLFSFLWQKKDCIGHLVKPTAVNFYSNGRLLVLWFGRTRDYLDSEEWQQSSFVIGPRNDKDFVGYPSDAAPFSPHHNHPLIFARSHPSTFSPSSFLFVAYTYTHTISLSLVTRVLRAGPMLSPVDNRTPTN